MNVYIEWSPSYNEPFMNSATLLTLLRIVSIPLMVFIFYLPFDWSKPVAGVIFALAAFTDWLDGYIARNHSQVTKFGAFLDPVADKLMVAVALVLIISEQAVPYLAVPAAIIVCREIVVSALREWMAEMGKRTSIAVTKIAKFKTLLQMLAVTMLLIAQPGVNIIWRLLGCTLLYLSAGLTLWSMVMYLRVAWPDLTLAENRE